ncbi:hypothetical protein [Thiocapsa imhoffii]|uniref:hypothetical protein n=1 Tax=Thiocapsa imhoffii TaxID=382777 RepID=UPI00190810D2|nr:hypothetical protein [Thiocapsa imhoffii]
MSLAKLVLQQSQVPHIDNCRAFKAAILQEKRHEANFEPFVSWLCATNDHPYSGAVNLTGKGVPCEMVKGSSTLFAVRARILAFVRWNNYVKFKMRDPLCYNALSVVPGTTPRL